MTVSNLRKFAGKPLAAWLTTLASVFVAGTVLGFGIGIWVSEPAPRPQLDASVPNYSNNERLLEEGDGLPVKVFRSERALKNFTFEEPTAPPVPDDVHLAQKPPGTVPQSTDSSGVVESEPTVSQPPSVPEEPVVAILPPPSAPIEPVKPNQGEETAAWVRNAVSIKVDYSKPMIAVIIDDLGIDQARTRATNQLPGPLTLSYIPYGYNLRDLVTDAKGRGHEIMLHLPMEPMNPDIDPGPNALLVGLDASERARRVTWALEQFDDFVGVNNHMGSRFTAWDGGMRPVLLQLKRHGLLFVDSITTQDTVGYRIAREIGIPNVTRDVFLDHDMRREAIAAALAQTERVAHRRGVAVAIGHPHDATVAELRRWIPTLRQKGIQLVPISAIVRASYPNG